jgi:hypothetical protein
MRFALLFMIACVTTPFSQAHAQMYQCPAGSVPVAGGGGMMCRCPDGSYAGISGCRVAQPQRVQPQIPNPQATFQAARQRTYAQAQTPAFNRATGQWEERRGQTRANSNGQKVWYQLRTYSGPAYVWIEYFDIFVEVPEDQYVAIFDTLESGNDEQFEETVGELNVMANNEGLITLE